MKIIIKFSPEITIKSRSVRLFFVKILIKNIKTIFQKNNRLMLITRYWDYLEIKFKNNNFFKISELLMYIPGIHHFLLVQDSVVNALEDIYHCIKLSNYQIRLLGKTFCVRVKRSGNHIFTSNEIESYLGNKLCFDVENARVNLTDPNEIIRLEIKNNRLFIVIERYEGLGGLPIGTQRESISLISGGFDSAVSSYMLIRRGCKVHYCFFGLLGSNNTVEIYKIVYYLWSKFSSSHTVKFIFINFVEVVNEIFSRIKDDHLSGIILKRMMIRAASAIASFWKIKVLVTGEVLGQVSTQTLDNLVLINNVHSADCMILRPLIAYDKELIIKLARKIGTEEFSRKIPEYCGLISKRSTIKAEKERIKLEESNFNYSILDNAVSKAHIMNVCDIPQYIEKKENIFEIETKTKLNTTDVLLDIRTENDQQNNPLKIPGCIKIKKIPFYKLIDQFPKLDQEKIYFLYCERGVMSRLQAIHLYQKGFRNIKIYRYKD